MSHAAYFIPIIHKILLNKKLLNCKKYQETMNSDFLFYNCLQITIADQFALLVQRFTLGPKRFWLSGG